MPTLNYLHLIQYISYIGNHKIFSAPQLIQFRLRSSLLSDISLKLYFLSVLSISLPPTNIAAPCPPFTCDSIINQPLSSPFKYRFFFVLHSPYNFSRGFVNRVATLSEKEKLNKRTHLGIELNQIRDLDILKDSPAAFKSLAPTHHAKCNCYFNLFFT